MSHLHRTHDHGHDHARGHRHGLRQLLSGHSHDAADRIDDALEADRAGRRALLISLAGLGITAAAQAVVVAFSGSVALLGDTLHNVADALTAVPLLIAFALGRRAASRRFSYGYGRAEDLAGLLVVVMIALSAVLAAVAAVRRLLDPQPVEHLWAVAGAAVVGFVGNELVARFRIRVGRRIGSAALVADGLHARTDGFTSLAVLLGAGGAALGWWWADPVVGLLIVVAIVAVLRSAIREVGSRLLDAVDPALLDRVADSLGGVEGVRAVRDLAVRWVGHRLRVEATLVTDPATDVGAVADLVAHARAHLDLDVGRIQAATLAVAPG